MVAVLRSDAIRNNGVSASLPPQTKIRRMVLFLWKLKDITSSLKVLINLMLKNLLHLITLTGIFATLFRAWKDVWFARSPHEFTLSEATEFIQNYKQKVWQKGYVKRAWACEIIAITYC